MVKVFKFELPTNIILPEPVFYKLPDKPTAPPIADCNDPQALEAYIISLTNRTEEEIFKKLYAKRKEKKISKDELFRLNEIEISKEHKQTHRQILDKHARKYAENWHNSKYLTLDEKQLKEKLSNTIAAMPEKARNAVKYPEKKNFQQRYLPLSADHFNTLALLQTSGKTYTLKPKCGCGSAHSVLHPAIESRLNLSKNENAFTETVRAQLRKRAAAKYQTNVWLNPLIQLNSCLKSSYSNTAQCSESLINKDGRLISAYCKNRWCLVCNRIKTANLINGYLPQIKKFDTTMFVTLTYKNVTSDNINKALRHYNIFFRNWYNRKQDALKPLRRKLEKLQRHAKTVNESDIKIALEIEISGVIAEINRQKPKGIKKIECTYNAKTNEYHPHIHILIDSEYEAFSLLGSWFNYCHKNNLPVDEQGQCVKPANEKIVKELFKYFTKMATATGEKEKTKVKTKKNTASITSVTRKVKLIYIDALDRIFCAMQKQQVFTAFGIKKVVDEDKREAIYTALEEGQSWVYSKELTDWVNFETGEVVSGYKPSQFEQMLPEKIVFDPKNIRKRETLEGFIKVEGKEYKLKRKHNFEKLCNEIHLFKL